MLKSFKYRIYPTHKQSVLLDRHIGACRFVYNLALETKRGAWDGYGINLSEFDLIKQLPDLKKECLWLNEINSQSLQQAIKNLNIAFVRFFDKKSAFPIFKKKTLGGSFNAQQGVSIKGEMLKIPKFQKGIFIVLHRPIKGVIKNVTVSKTTTGKYFASILCETGEVNKPKSTIKKSTSIGIDLGIKSFLVTSEGQEFENPKFLRKSLSRLKYVQRIYSKKKGKRTKHKLAILHEKVANQRKDFLHKTSTMLIRDNQTICVEDLAVSNMVKNHKLAQAIGDVSWGEFIRQLSYKSEWYGVNLLKIGRFEPSSKICNCCGEVNKELTLKDREWTCMGCYSLLDRDLNAAINIKNFALRKLSAEHRLKNRDELPSIEGVLTCEA